MKTVQDIFDRKQKAYNFISPDTIVFDALVQLNSVNLSYLVVMENNKYRGLFSERDYTRNVILKGRASNSTKVSEVMSVDFPIVRMTDSVEHCMQLINAHKTRYLLAYDDAHNFVGVVTIHDLLRQVLADKEAVFESLLGDDDGWVF